VLAKELQEWERSGSYLPIDGRQIFTIQRGDDQAEPSETLLLLHGFPESSFSFHKVISALATRFERVIAIDFLGFGLSDKPRKHPYSLMEQTDILLDIWQNLGVRGGHLLAHDMGDSVATEIVARMAEGRLYHGFTGLQSLTFTNGNMVMEHAKLRLTQVMLQKPFLGPLMGRLTNFRIFRQQVQSASGGKGLPERDIELMWNNIKHKNGTRISHRLIRYLDERRQHQNNRWLPALGETKIPVHICWGRADSVAPEAVARFLYEEICPNATLSWLEDVGHFCQQEAPDDWISATATFWGSL
jgi:pimeloyl-ACP methyl ester carboxylesterase